MSLRLKPGPKPGHPSEPEPQRAAQSFRKNEIDAVRSLISIARRGGDVSILLRSPELLNVERKFNRMSIAAKPDAARGQA